MLRRLVSLPPSNRILLVGRRGGQPQCMIRDALTTKSTSGETASTIGNPTVEAGRRTARSCSTTTTKGSSLLKTPILGRRGGRGVLSHTTPTLVYHSPSNNIHNVFLGSTGGRRWLHMSSFPSLMHVSYCNNLIASHAWRNLIRFRSSSSSSSSSGGKTKKKDETKVEESSSSTTTASSAATRPNEEWVAFQRQIAVAGFDTGQQVQMARQSRRGGKKLKKQKQVEDDSKRFTDLAGGEFPPFRYSDEETNRLLAQAYANIPERAGKRGTRNLKRQSKRWFLVRKVRKLYKYQLAQHQQRKMSKRSEKVRLVKQVLEEAPIVQGSDRQYQAKVFAKWSARMTGSQKVGHLQVG